MNISPVIDSENDTHMHGFFIDKSHVEGSAMNISPINGSPTHDSPVNGSPVILFPRMDFIGMAVM